VECDVTYVIEYESPSGSTRFSNLDGVPWYEAPIPKRLHRCWPQTKGRYNYLTLVERCACGSIRRPDGPWIERNSRK
jgi:hypothetical protein